MSRSERLKAALVALVDDRRSEIDALKDVRMLVISLELDDAGAVNSEQVRYDMKRRTRYERGRRQDGSRVA